MSDYSFLGTGDCESSIGNTYDMGEKRMDNLTESNCMNYCNRFNTTDLVGFTLYNDGWWGNRFCNCRYNDGKIPGGHSQTWDGGWGNGPVSGANSIYSYYSCYGRIDI